jgi:hypothetical protein
MNSPVFRAKLGGVYLEGGLTRMESDPMFLSLYFTSPIFLDEQTIPP